VKSADQNADQAGHNGAAKAAVLKRCRALLASQRDRFQRYLDLLDRQREAIEAGNIEALSTLVEAEEQVCGAIVSLERTLRPMMRLYRAMYSGRADAPDEAEIAAMSAHIASLHKKAEENLKQNRELLSTRMAAIGEEIRSLHGNPYLTWRKVYTQAAPALVDIDG